MTLAWETDAHLRLAERALLRGDHDTAEYWYKRALDAEPDNEVILYNLAVTHLQSGKPGDAIQALNRLQGSRGAEAMRYAAAYQRAVALSQSEAPDAQAVDVARSLLSELLERAPRDRTEAAPILQQLEGATAALLAGLLHQPTAGESEPDPRDAPSRDKLTDLLAQPGVSDEEKARALEAFARKEHGDDPSTQYNLAQLRMARDDSDGARRELASAARAPEIRALAESNPVLKGALPPRAEATSVRVTAQHHQGASMRTPAYLQAVAISAALAGAIFLLGVVLDAGGWFESFAAVLLAGLVLLAIARQLAVGVAGKALDEAASARAKADDARDDERWERARVLAFRPLAADIRDVIAELTSLVTESRGPKSADRRDLPLLDWPSARTRIAQLARDEKRKHQAARVLIDIEAQHRRRVAAWAEPMVASRELRAAMDRLACFDDDLVALRRLLHDARPNAIVAHWGRIVTEAVSLIEDLRPGAAAADLRRIVPDEYVAELDRRAASGPHDRKRLGTTIAPASQPPDVTTGT